MTTEYTPSAIGAQLSPVLKRALLWLTANDDGQQSERDDIRLSDLMCLWTQNLAVFRVSGWRLTPRGDAVSKALVSMSGDE
jgi:hypothetical protein